MFEDDVIPGKPAILSWQEDGWVVQRPFSFADHVNDYWDEALNINHFDKLLYDRMKERLAEHCPEFRLDPESYRIEDEDEDELQDKYAHLQLRDTSELRLDMLCQANNSAVITHQGSD